MYTHHVDHVIVLIDRSSITLISLDSNIATPSYGSQKFEIW